MADLTTVAETVEGWKNAVLVKDEATGRHFVVSTASPEWAPDRYETVAYESDSTGSFDSVIELGRTEDFGAPAWVAGARGMGRDEALADLSARLDDNVLLTPEQVEAANRAKYEQDEEEYQAWLLDAANPLQVLLDLLGANA